jgi:hypothetical protein
MISTITLNDIQVPNGITISLGLGSLNPNFTSNIKYISLTTSGPTASWNIIDYTPDINLSLINQVLFEFRVSTEFPISGTIGNLTGELVCLASNTKILMADGTIKKIKDLQRGEFVAGNKENTIHYQISRKIHTHVGKEHLVDVVKIKKDALGENYPDYDTIITAWHPILYKDARRPAKCFKKFKGVQYSKKRVFAETILVADESETEKKTYSLYNLQFDTEGFFVANGLVVQSVSPHSALVPLPEEDYFDKSKFNKPRVKESYHEEYPWINKLVDPEQ